MVLPEPLRNNPFRSRNRRSLHSLFDEGYSGPVKPLEDAHRGPASLSRQSPAKPRGYMADLTEDYMPQPGAMSVPDNDYEPYDGLCSPTIHPVNVPAGHARLAPLLEPEVQYEDCLIDEDVFQHQLKLILQQFKETLPQPFDNNAMLAEALKKAQKEGQADVLEDVVRKLVALQDSMNRSRAHGAESNLEESEPEMIVPLPDLSYQAVEPAPRGLIPDNYLSPMSEDFFELQAQLMERQFSQPDVTGVDISEHTDAVFNAQEALFNMLQGQIPSVEEAISDQMAGTPIHESDLGHLSLEQIVDALEMQSLVVAPEEVGGTPSYDDCLMDSILFEQQVHEAAGQMESVGPLQDQMPDPNDMMPQPYDPQMQQMMDPYMMPGPMGPGPMMDPGGGGT